MYVAYFLEKKNKYELCKAIIPRYLRRIQSCEHISASKISGVSRLWFSLRTRPLVLKANSEATVLIGMAKISRAIFLKISRAKADFDWR
jgi:hypothetical protein